MGGPASGHTADRSTEGRPSDNVRHELYDAALFTRRFKRRYRQWQKRATAIYVESIGCIGGDELLRSDDFRLNGCSAACQQWSATAQRHCCHKNVLNLRSCHDQRNLGTCERSRDLRTPTRRIAARRLPDVGGDRVADRGWRPITCRIAARLRPMPTSRRRASGHTARLPPVNATRANVGPNGAASFRLLQRGRNLAFPCKSAILIRWPDRRSAVCQNTAR